MISTSEGIADENFVDVSRDIYNDLNLEFTPPSVDCLIILKCKGDSYKLVLVELKNIKKLNYTL